MTYYYAQIDGNGVVISVTQTHAPIDAPHLIAIESLDVALLGATYANGAFTPGV